MTLTNYFNYYLFIILVKILLCFNIIMNNSNLKDIGRKIPKKYENPIDNILYDLSDYLNPYYKKLEFTPNTLTTLSILLTLLGLYLYKKKYIILGSILVFIGYYFDCADGSYARKYKMETKYGDYYDHIGDVLKIILTLYLLYTLKLKRYFIYFLVIMSVIFGIICFIHVGCQEKYYKMISKLKNLTYLKSHTLKNTEKLCPNYKYMVFTRWFGPGTIWSLISLFLIFLKPINKLF